jgi:hypothetical protein
MIQAIQVRGETVGAYQLGWAGRWCEVRRIAVERLVQLCAAGKLSPDTVSQLRPLADAIARPHDDHNDATKAPNYTSDCYSHRDNGGVGIRLPLNAPTRDF